MNDIQKAAQVLRDGGIVIFPTDTAFGIGCRMDDPEAVKRLFALRKRDTSKATPVLASDVDMFKPFIKPLDQDVIDSLVTPHWPGGLTIVVPCHTDNIPELVRNGETLGIRVPDHDGIRAIIKEVGVPIIGSSANFAGNPTPFKQEDLDPELLKLVDYVVPGQTHAKSASTVISVIEKPWKILRQGAVQLKI